MTNKKLSHPEARRGPVLGPEGVELDLLGRESRVGQLDLSLVVKQRSSDLLNRIKKLLE